MTATVWLGVLNLNFPGAALLWRRQTIQAIVYCVSFTILKVFRSDIGAGWAIYVWLIAQIHFFKLRKPDRVRDLGPLAKKLVWTFIGLAMLSYAVLYGVSWTRMMAKARCRSSFSFWLKRRLLSPASSWRAT